MRPMSNLESSLSHRELIAGVPCDFISREQFLSHVQRHITDTSSSLLHVVTLNAEMVVEAQKNEEFRHILQTTYNIPDGSSMLWAKAYLAKKEVLIVSLIKFLFSKQQPVTGVDSMLDICNILDKQNGTALLIGTTQEERLGTKKSLEHTFPNLNIIIAEDLPTTSYKLQASAAIFVALGAPKQTLWIEKHRHKLEQSGVRCAMGVGGAFAMISGALPRAPQLIRRFHLEWLWRLLLEPTRLKRIYSAVILFPKLIALQNGYPH